MVSQSRYSPFTTVGYDLYRKRGTELEVTCSVDTMRDALYTVKPLTSQRCALPILNNILVDARNGMLSLTAFDLEVALQLTLSSASLKRDGATTVPASALVACLIGLAGSDEVSLSQKGNRLVVTCLTGRTFEYSLATLPADEFPAVPELNAQASTRVGLSDLATALKRTVFAASTDEVNIKAGVLIAQRDPKLRFVGTDLHRLAMCEIDAQFGGQHEEAVLSRKAVDALRRLCDRAADGAEDISFTVTPDLACFVVDGERLTARLPQGTYPKYEAYLPKEWTSECNVDVSLLSAALERLSVVDDGIGRIILSTDGDKLFLGADDSDIGEGRETIPFESHGTLPEMWRFRRKYMLDYLTVVGCEGVRWQFNEELTPAQLTPIGRDGELYLLLHMLPRAG